MKRTHWGSFEDSSDTRKETEASQIVLPISKMEKFQQIKLPYIITREKRVPLKNPLVTQTVEVMKQTEMIQTLIDTYSTKSGCNYILNPCQLMPTVHFPSSNVVDLTRAEKITRPLWFVNPASSAFTRGDPKNFVKLSKPAVLQALRKAACGLLCMEGFSEINESALIMIVDGLDQFLRLEVESMRSVVMEDSREVGAVADVLMVERMYHSVGRTSVCDLHNYYKRLMRKNRTEVREFKDIYQEYDRLLQENQLSVQNMQKLGDSQEDDYMSFLDPQSHSSNGTTIDGSTMNIISFINGESVNGFKDILEGELLESNSTQDSTDQMNNQQFYQQENPPSVFVPAGQNNI
ncbi:AGAP000250-PA-like protein [Anopheles sinensis]|uniref:AGAP000250-PA-like protein n=1 Tax=Anopheles sinensis TaxID=74873 RepID=A0A084VH12_ANOSI|nr:AGAP000250-PA-like protein [Anopheles sinensis]